MLTFSYAIYASLLQNATLMFKRSNLWELNSFMTGIDKLNFNNTANYIGERFINEDLDLAYFFMLASYSIPSDTSTNVDSDFVSAMHALASLHTPIRLCFMTHERVITHMHLSSKC